MRADVGSETGLWPGALDEPGGALNEAVTNAGARKLGTAEHTLTSGIVIAYSCHLVGPNAPSRAFVVATEVSSYRHCIEASKQEYGVSAPFFVCEQLC